MPLRQPDAFLKNIVLVFFGAGLVSVLNLAAQLFLAHALSPVDFAGFNTLLSIFVLIASPLTTLQVGVAKYVSEFQARGEHQQGALLVMRLLRIAATFAVVTLILFLTFSPMALVRLRVAHPGSSLMLGLLLGLSWLSPVILGSLQGRELFVWLALVSVAAAAVKFACTIVFVHAGYSISGALAAFLAGGVVTLGLGLVACRKLIIAAPTQTPVNLRPLVRFLVPVAVSSFCFIVLTNIDMVLVRYFFSPELSGSYSLAQMLGKIFLFLPAAISVVMFPRASALHAQSNQTAHLLYRSLAYAGVLCILAFAGYTVMPTLVLRLLTGKAAPDAVLLGRLFGISMSFFAFSFIAMTYLLSISDFRFVRYLVLCVVLELAGIVVFHQHLWQIQVVLCCVAAVLSISTLTLAHQRAQ